jgi:hypothetical protein
MSDIQQVLLEGLQLLLLLLLLLSFYGGKWLLLLLLDLSLQLADLPLNLHSLKEADLQKYSKHNEP